MSNLILSFISIALIAATAAAVIMFGGDAVRSGGLKAQYTQIVNEARNLELASHLYMNDHGGIPEDLDGYETLSEYFFEKYGTKYIKAKPTGIEAIAGESSSSIWHYNGYINHGVSSEETCAKFNFFAGGSDDPEEIPNCEDGYDPRNPCCR